MDSYKLDQTDIKILNLLQSDGLMTNRELAKQTHRTHNPINERVARLKKLGYIKKTVAIVDLKKVRDFFTAYPLIQLKDHHEKTFVEFQQMVAQHPEIMECNHIMGEFDFILKIMVFSSNDYNRFLRENITPLTYISKVQSFPVLAEIKKETTYKL
ncbi:winged helix-turn-helix transcriptional regulator [Pedobacter sp. LMG 31464]|uniref:Winged helix-turn-helix transcriptional regulator n=1 Tax=Pedobacter planticolens TaxID=2679964 RepID=A0A923E2E8_9SPHI|nr:Lrp/AsnC family transcriptional regulator [Pedobacter planticolens]MBB2146793.1 winged helix-turn-helix transcriptional regulator [Pedobacter planticolens]